MAATSAVEARVTVTPVVPVAARSCAGGASGMPAPSAVDARATVVAAAARASSCASGAVSVAATSAVVAGAKAMMVHT